MRDLDEFLEVKALELPIRGKLYAFPGSISARAWLLVQRIGRAAERAERAKQTGQEYEPDELAMSDAEEIELQGEMFGDVDEQMAADGLSSAHVKHVFATLLAYHYGGRELAERVWDGQGGASAPNRAARRHAPTRSTPSRGSRVG